MNATAKVWESNHRAQRRARKRIYRQKRLEHVREKDRVYAATRNMRQKAIPGTLTQEQIQEKLKKQRYKCYYCAVKFEKRNGRYVYHLEHTIPISRVEAGPRHDVNYVVLSCPHCNAKKHNKLPHEWLEGGRLF
jgi:5-methylcytosine-specific restriction endonuclease McrA